MTTSCKTPIPVLRFNSRSHPSTEDIFAYSKRSCDQFLKAVL